MKYMHVGAWASMALLVMAMLACNPFASASNLASDPQLGRIQTLAAQTALAGGNDSFAREPSPQPTVSASGRVGERISAQTIALTASQVERSQGTTDVKPEQGKEFLIIHLQVENLDDSTGLEVDDGDFQLRDASGDSVDAFPEDITADQIQDLDLGPTEKAKGTIVFQIPVGDKGLHLLYDFNERHIDIDLGQ